MNEWILLLGMMAVTYSVRYLPFAFAGRIYLPGWMQRALAYVPICVLSAIIFPAVIAPKGAMDFSLENSYLIAALVSAAVAYFTKNLLATIFTGMVAFLLWRLLWL